MTELPAFDHKLRLGQDVRDWTVRLSPGGPSPASWTPESAFSSAPMITSEASHADAHARLFDPPPSVFDLSAIDGNNGFKLLGASVNSFAGCSVSAGDVNGDGFDDVIVGARGAASFAGAAYVVFGHASGIPASLNLFNLDGTNGFKLAGAAGDEAGISVSSAGDINHDGFADLMVGARSANPHGNDSGVTYVVFGKASGWTASADLSTLDGHNGYRLSGEHASDFSGQSVSDAGDVNGDGYGDYLIGANKFDPHSGHSNDGAAYLLFGHRSDFTPNLNLSVLNGNSGFQINGVATNDYAGISVSSAGDFNGDGLADLVVGAWGADPHGSFSGSAYVIFGHATPWPAEFELSALTGANGFRLDGAAANYNTGICVSDAGDVNGDGFGDIIIGADGASPHGAHSGTSYVVFGTDTAFAATMNLSTLDGSNGFRINGVALSDYSGVGVSGAGDVNGDGFSDLIVGADATDVHGEATGSAYVIYGKATFGGAFNLSNLDGNNGFRIDGEAGGDFVGPALSAADVNGDGFSDLIVGARYNPTAEAFGATYVIYGAKPDGPVSKTGTDAGQTLAGGDFNDTLSALGGNDRLFGNGGDDILFGGTGKNIFYGGEGSDTVNYSWAPGGITANLDNGRGGGASDDKFVSIENLTGSPFTDKLFGDNNANVLAGGAGNDAINASGGNDRLLGGLGSDSLNGGNGRDTFVYFGASESNSSGADNVVGFDANRDFFDVWFAFGGVDTAVTHGDLSNATFDSDLMAAIGTGQLGRHHAVLFTPDGGDLAGITILIIDGNNARGYQAGVDMIVALTSPLNLDSLDASNFI